MQHLLQHSFIYYLRNKSRPRKRLTEDAQQSSVKSVAGDLTLDCSIIRANVFIVKNLVLMTKNILIEKTLKLLA